jgi:hypothetical protein
VARLHAWLAVAPFAAASVLAGHALAYRLTATDGEGVHAYLAHAPQVLALLLLVSAALAYFSGRRANAPFWQFAVVAPVAFLLQEHLERLVHDGQIPWLLTSPALLLGLLLQLPLALLGAIVARWLLSALAEAVPVLRPRVRWPSLLMTLSSQARVPSVWWAVDAARAPPALLRS